MLLCRVYPAAFVLLRSIYRFAILVFVEITLSWRLMFIFRFPGRVLADARQVQIGCIVLPRPFLSISTCVAVHERSQSCLTSFLVYHCFHSMHAAI